VNQKFFSRKKIARRTLAIGIICPAIVTKNGKRNVAGELSIAKKATDGTLGTCGT